MTKEKSFEEQLLDKYPNMYNPKVCSICAADLRCLDTIHRRGMEWYCDKCYKKYGDQKNEKRNKERKKAGE